MTALLVNIFQRQQEARNPFYKELESCTRKFANCTPTASRLLHAHFKRNGTKSSELLMKSEMKWIGSIVLSASLGLSAAGNQTPALKRVMREKLEHSQKILEAVVTSDWMALERHSRELERLTDSPAWSVLKTPEYVRQSAAFLRATQDLLEAARQRDLETAPVAYVSLTLSCVQCHRYVARARIARLEK